ncbi:MAG TPA: hypothetical protein VML75_12090 [Kofleriaceae bacterium]|nr:hypothetical protein [Kofleriaceae bacterium]
MDPPSRICSLLLLALATACDAGDARGPDGGADTVDAGADAASGACAEFAAPAVVFSSYPASYSGTVTGAGADVDVAAGQCNDQRGFFDPQGEDVVIELAGLGPGTDYVVKLDGAGDVSFYVATGCNELTAGPGTNQCLLFVDSGGAHEHGDFTAPGAGPTYLVIDHFGTEPLVDGAFTVRVTEAECSASSECDGQVCFGRLCVECGSPFDCTSASAPACDPVANICVVNDQCTGDDGRENADDGPAGAVALAFPSMVSGAVCNAPLGELDWFRFDLSATADRALQLDWNGTADLDLVVTNEVGTTVAGSLFNHPELLNLRDLPAGRYYAVINQFDGTSPVAVPYTLSATIPECRSAFDCTQPDAPVCGPAGACIAGPAQCTGDDPDEGPDDGPAGAIVLTSGQTATGKICNAPASERDYYRITTAAGDSLDIVLAWTDSSADLDLIARLPDGRQLGMAFWGAPEHMRLTNLPAGDIYLEVLWFGDATTAAIDYSITATRAAGGCTTTADCAADHQSQLFRGDCRPSGACQFVEGGAALTAGSLCDSDDDCASAVCSYWQFASNAESSVCTTTCMSTSDCAAGLHCTTPFTRNFCRPPCASHSDCGANIGSDNLDSGEVWDYHTCNPATSSCDL